MRVEIDSRSGFCGGVIRAIETAEEHLAEGGKIYSLGAIVHNEEELSRLETKGLVTIDKEDLDQISPRSGEPLLIRAHGEPPAVYGKLNRLGFTVIDCTCPVVLKLQKDISAAYARVKSPPRPGEVLIFGKPGHAEVMGLLGQVEGDAFVVEYMNQLDLLFETGALKTDRPLEVFSQTTMAKDEYRQLCAALAARFSETGLLKVHDTICKQLAARYDALASFAASHDIIIFVSGKSSSNGKVLCELCRSRNIRTCHIGAVEDIHREWFRPDDNVGVCGATSTPLWLLEEVALAIQNLQ